MHRGRARTRGLQEQGAAAIMMPCPSCCVGGVGVVRCTHLPPMSADMGGNQAGQPWGHTHQVYCVCCAVGLGATG